MTDGGCGGKLYSTCVHSTRPGAASWSCEAFKGGTCSSTVDPCMTNVSLWGTKSKKGSVQCSLWCGTVLPSGRATVMGAGEGCLVCATVQRRYALLGLNLQRCRMSRYIDCKRIPYVEPGTLAGSVWQHADRSRTCISKPEVLRFFRASVEGERKRKVQKGYKMQIC